MDRKRRAAQSAVLARIIRTAREEAELTQAEVASRLAMPQSFVSKIESGERRLDFVELREVCAALGMPLSTIVKRFEATLEKAARPPR